MGFRFKCELAIFILLVLINMHMLSFAHGASLDLLGQEIIQTCGADITVCGYSVPIVFDWNNDGRKDLIIGEQPTPSTGKIRVYLNAASDSDPLFGSYSYVQSNCSDLVLTGSGCLGAAPCIVYWNVLGRKDLLVGTAAGNIILFHNTGDDNSPAFDGGTAVLFGPAVGKTQIDVGLRAIPFWTDWNNDGKKDLVVGAYDGKIRLYINSGTNDAPDFLIETFIQCGTADLIVPSGRSAPAICDFDGDNKKDIISGNTNGQLLFYHNIGTDADPCFANFVQLRSMSNALELSPAGLRTRPFVCDWDNDSLCDIVVGYGDGKVHLFCGTFCGDLDYNKTVNMPDFGIFSQQWLGSDNLNGDISPPDGDGIVDIFDLAVFTENWLSPLN